MVLRVARSFVGEQHQTVTPGTVEVEADNGQPWAGLLEGATPVSGMLVETTGDAIFVWAQR